MNNWVCGLLQNQYNVIVVFDRNNHVVFPDVNENRFSLINKEQTDINWSGHPLTTRFDPLPRVVWRDNSNVDIYVKTRVRFGTMRRDSFVYDIDPKTHKTISTPFNIIVHYDRED